MPYIILFLIFLVVGTADTIYLVKKRKQGEAPVCPLRGDCSFVLQSKYNKVFGVHTDIIGLSYFVGMVLSVISVIIALLILSALPLSASGDLTPGGIVIMFYLATLYVGVLGSTLLAFLMTLRMLFIQFFVIRKMCFWCLLSSVCVIGITVTVFLPFILTLVRH